MTDMTRRQFVDTAKWTALAVPCCPWALQAAAAKTDRGKADADSFKMVAPCGMYCGSCSTLVNSLQAETEDGVKCRGCLSDKVVGFCSKCGIRKCAMSRGHTSCTECSEYETCKKLAQFLKHPLMARPAANLKRIEKIGIEAWEKEQEKAWTCAKCGARFSGKDKRCRKCNAPLAKPT